MLRVTKFFFLLKWCDFEVIYSISYSPWVKHIHMIHELFSDYGEKYARKRECSHVYQLKTEYIEV